MQSTSPERGTVVIKTQEGAGPLPSRPPYEDLRVLREGQPLTFPVTAPSSVVEIDGKPVDVYGDNSITIDGGRILNAVQTPLGKVAVVQTSARLGDDNGAGTARHGHIDFKNSLRNYKSLGEMNRDAEWRETVTESFTAVVKAYEEMGYRVVMTGSQVFDSDASLASRERALFDGFRTHEGHRRFNGRARVDFMVYDSNGRPASAPLLLPALAGTTVKTEDGRAGSHRNDFGIFAAAHHPEFETRSGHGGREHGFSRNLIAVGDPSPQVDPQWALNQIAAGNLGAPSLGDTSPLISKVQQQISWLQKTTDNAELADVIEKAAPGGVRATGKYTPEFDSVVRAINDYFDVPASLRREGEMGAPFVNILNASIARVHSRPQDFHVANADISKFVDTFNLPGQSDFVVASSEVRETPPVDGGFALRNVEVTEKFRQNLESLAKGGLGSRERIGWGENHPDFDLNSLRTALKSIADLQNIQDSFIDKVAESEAGEFTIDDQIALKRVQSEIISGRLTGNSESLVVSGDVDSSTAAALLELLSDK